MNKWDTRNKQEFSKYQKWGNKSVKSGTETTVESRANPTRDTRAVPATTTQYDPTRDGARSKKKKAPGACYQCQQMGHFANRCPEKQRSQGHSKKQQVSTKKTEIEEEDEDSVNSPELLQFHSLQVMANKKSSGRRQLDVKAINIKTL